MDSLSPYEQLQVSEDASFEEIQAARDRLVAQLASNDVQRDKIEAAYDAVLMDRLRLRQEGKIKVPERIRFAEKMVAEATAKPSVMPALTGKPWLRDLWAAPVVADLFVPTAVYAVLVGMSLYASEGLGRDANPRLVEVLSNNLAFLLAIGVGFSVYWLNRKQQRLGRSFLLSLLGVVAAAILGALIIQVASPALLALPIITWVTVAIFVVLWIVTGFLQ